MGRAGLIHYPQQADNRFVSLFFLITILLASIPTVEARDSTGINPVEEQLPHVDKRGKQAYQKYLNSYDHKAFAIAPGGPWGWSAEESSTNDAIESALKRCQKHAAHPCIPYAVGDQVVFDRQRWITLWRPFPDQKSAHLASQGSRVGERFPDLQFFSPTGEPHALSDRRGKITILHFWGSWCPSCILEMPQLQKLNHAIQKEFPGDVSLILLQVREPFSESLRWARRNHFDDLPLHHSGINSEEESLLTLSSGERISDRAIAKVFPTTYIIGRHGSVLFSHRGPIDHWLQYLPFIEDAVDQTKFITTETR